LTVIRFQSTPPRGRRYRHDLCVDRFLGFNPRLRAGGDGLPSMTGPAHGCFNPRLRAGGDRSRRGGGGPGIWVSIHASAREAMAPACSSPPRRRFNPRLRAGGDSRIQSASVPGSTFQSTPPRGRRLKFVRRPCSVLARFNPRLRAGGDEREPLILAIASVSIHASAREAIVLGFSFSSQAVFQSTPPRGRRYARIFGI